MPWSWLPGSAIRLYWYGHQNFGDALSPMLVEALSGRRVERAPDDRPWTCQLVAIGSVLHFVNNRRFRGAIWGTGTLGPLRGGTHCTGGKVLATRGRLTADLLGAPRGLPMGDPGLLADRFARGLPKRFRLGLVPHFKDRAHPAVQAIARRDPSVSFIDVCQPVRDVIDRISECEAIVSSSLHGLIVADTLGIPNARTVLSDQVLGGDFKFNDYYSAFGLSPQPTVRLDPGDDAQSIRARLPACERPGLDELKRGLIETFPFPRRRAFLAKFGRPAGTATPR